MIKTIPVLKGLHWGAERALRQLGAEWELRRSGETVLGLWKFRISSSSRSPRKTRSNRKALKRLVVIPGFGDSSLAWMGLVTFLMPALKRAGYDEILFFDFPGFHGFLSQEKCFSDADEMMSVCGDVLDSLTPHAVFGHSLGGLMSAHYAALCGERKRPAVPGSKYRGPELLIAVSPSGAYGSTTELQGMVGIFESAVKEGFQKLAPHLFKEQPPLWFRAFYPECNRFIQREDVVKLLTSFDRRHFPQDRLNQIRGKVSVIWGDSDTLVPSAWIHAWLSRLTHADVQAEGILIPGAGHSPHIEAPVAMATLLSRILEGKKTTPLRKAWTVLEPLATS